ncbi:TraR/DksA C4-type zinc finger protein [Candidatus Bathyarchaeota archaeon]|nr:TraR/DksA C4-type zinc finger protein [Candidatus Bathyarchaeota archaeon]
MVDYTLVKKAEEFHGHICPFLVLGLRASEIAMKRLGVKKASAEETIGEEILAIIECNNCFADGVQVATGCTLGNNSLIYLDVGKNAVTLVKRDEWRGIRVYVDSEKIREKYFNREARELFEKVVVRREGSREDNEKLRKMWSEIGLLMANAPEELFEIEEVNVAEIERAPIFESVRCEICGELAMKTRVRTVNGKTICLSCLGECEAIVGRGIVPNFKTPFRR